MIMRVKDIREEMHAECVVCGLFYLLALQSVCPSLHPFTVYLSHRSISRPM